VVQATPALSVQFCRFPGCFEAPRPASGPGKPPAYCDTVVDERGQPAHTAVRSMRMRNRLRSGGPRAAAAAVPSDQSNERPVSRARYTVPDLVERVERLVTEQQAMTSRALADLQSTVALLGDDEARAAEIESVQHDTNRLVEEAKGETLAAEKAARSARATAEQARTAEAEAIVAAEEALARAERIETDAAERIEAAEQRQQEQAEADQARVGVAELAADDARAELERVRTDATERIAAATADAEEHKRRVVADRDHVLAERQAEADAQVESALQELQQVRAEADQRVRDADRATSRAEQAAEDARADRHRQVEQVTRLQGELAEARERLEAAEQRHRAERDRQAEQLREAADQATAARVELATATAQLDTERAAHEREQQAAVERLNEARAQARQDADQRVIELRSTYETRLADEQARHTGEMEQLRHQLAEATTTTRRRRGDKEDQ
jgi:hypothetical protein